MKDKRDVIRWTATGVIAAMLLVAIGIVVWFRLNPAPPVDLMPGDEWFSDIYPFRTESFTDTENLNAILERLPVPAKMKATGEIETTDTEEKGKRLRIYYTCSGSPSALLDDPDNKGKLDVCGMALFCLVGDLDHVSFVVTGGDEETVMPYGRDWADHNIDESVYESSTTIERFKLYCRRILDLHQASVK